ncbi:MAG: aryl-sulfate sulfotransferase [Bacteroidota bacterium]
MQKVFALFFFLFTLCPLVAQQTIGLFLNDSTAYNGYTLFPTTSSMQTHLIDNCGELVHLWNSEFQAAMQAYLLEDGRLLRAERVPNSFNAGGSGGRIALFDWDSNLLWGFNYSNDSVHQHHDVEYLPNGNILVLAWEAKTVEEATEAGRDLSITSVEGLWPDHIVELEVLENNETNIVWEWYVWDHLIQDFDATKANYGVIEAHPELIDLNKIPLSNSVGGGTADWNHINAIDYNPELDQIILSCRNFNEVWIIDHSTTTEEAAGHSGGNSGKGGDLLYRWGNPAMYNQGSPEDQKLFAQHDAHWIEPGLPDAGKIMIFNNGPGRPEGNFSSVDIIEPEIDGNGQYVKEAGIAFGPNTLSWTYQSDPPSNFFEQRVSGAQQQPNGNVLICAGRTGTFFEVNVVGDTVWRYTNPISSFGAVTQGNQNSGGATFRVYRYAPDYPALVDKDLMPMGPLELGPLPSDCQIYEDVTTNTVEVRPKPAKIYPNPFDQFIQLQIEGEQSLEISIFNLQGQKISSTLVNEGIQHLDTSLWPRGIYLMRAINQSGQMVFTEKLLK